MKYFWTAPNFEMLADHKSSLLLKKELFFAFAQKGWLSETDRPFCEAFFSLLQEEGVKFDTACSILLANPLGLMQHCFRCQ